MRIRAIPAIALLGVAVYACNAPSDESAKSTDLVTYESSSLLTNPDMIAALKEACQEMRRVDFVIDTAADAELALRSFQAGAGSGTFTDDEAAYLIGAGFGRYCPDRIDL